MAHGTPTAPAPASNGSPGGRAGGPKVSRETPARATQADGASAPGSPGGAGRWTPGAKVGVGTALSESSSVWFTLSNGVLTEVYYPSIDTASTRDLQLLVADRQDFFSEEKRDTH